MTDEEQKNSNNNSSSTTAWKEWPMEMPVCKEEVYCPEYDILNSKSHLRLMLSEIRKKIFRMAKSTQSRFKLDRIQSSAILLQGGKDSTFEFYDNDTLISNFRQEPFFRYIFGLNEPNAMGILDLEREEVILLVSPLPISSERWLGKSRSFNYYEKEYACDEVGNIENIEELLKRRNIQSLYLLKGMNTDSGLQTKTTADFNSMKDDFWIDCKQLHRLLSEARVHKTPAEIQLLKNACLVTSKGHLYVMRHIQPMMSERQLEALFKGYVYYFGGARHQAYECICGSGNHGSILHYGHSGYPNDKILVDGECVVLDMGGEYMGYATDITCSYPVNGKFTDKQCLMHTAVYEAQKNVLCAMKPGVLWTDMHLLAERTIVEHLLKYMKILHCPQSMSIVDEREMVDYFMSIRVPAVFMPHGLGHFLGMNVHDVGGYNDEYVRSQEIGLCWLRTSRMLEENMFLTVEPGLYFNEAWVKQMVSKYPKIAECIDDDVLGGYFGIGGCRLEDDVLVTKNGVENFTVCPRSVKEIECAMQHLCSMW